MMTASELTTSEAVIAQLVFCLGCCCGRTDRGRPEVPVERLKQVWRAEKLREAVHLSISGCLGPCDRANVALVLTPAGCMWLGNLTDATHYEALIRWARQCHAAQLLRPLPASLAAHRFARFTAEASSSREEV